MYWNIKDVFISTEGIILSNIKCILFKKLFKNLEPQIFIMHLLNRNPVRQKRENIGSHMRVFTALINLSLVNPSIKSSYDANEF